jgi:hypothetical protein
MAQLEETIKHLHQRGYVENGEIETYPIKFIGFIKLGEEGEKQIIVEYHMHNETVKGMYIRTASAPW